MTVPQNVAVRFKSSICPLTAWQKVNTCISGTISNFPTKSWLCYKHGNFPEDMGYIQQAETSDMSVLEGCEKDLL